jgi:hypothetical protein
MEPKAKVPAPDSTPVSSTVSFVQLGEIVLDTKLDELCDMLKWTAPTTITLPKVDDLWESLELPMHNATDNQDQSTAALREKLKKLSSDLVQAETEVKLSLSLPMSAFMQDAAKQQVTATNDEIQKVQKAIQTGSDKDAGLTFVALDCKRADAVKTRNNWVYRVDAKKSGVRANMELFRKQTAQAIEALELQDAAVEERYQAHLSAWDIANAAVEAKHTSKIANLENLCSNSKSMDTPMPTAEDDAPTIDDSDAQISQLQALVIELQSQLKNSGIPPVTQAKQAPAADGLDPAGNKRIRLSSEQATTVSTDSSMTEVLSDTSNGLEHAGGVPVDVSTGDVVDENALPMSIAAMAEEEKVARLQRASELRQLSESKGKGKGSDSSSSPSPGLEY